MTANQKKKKNQSPIRFPGSKKGELDHVLQKKEKSVTHTYLKIFEISFGNLQQACSFEISSEKKR